VFESSCSSSGSEDSQRESEDENLGPRTSTSTPSQTSTSTPSGKRGRTSVVTPTLVAMLDRNKLSDRAATI